MSPEDREACVWFQEDARYTYGQAAAYRESAKPGSDWVAVRVQEAAAWSAAKARALLGIEEAAA